MRVLQITYKDLKNHTETHQLDFGRTYTLYRPANGQPLLPDIALISPFASTEHFLVLDLTKENNIRIGLSSTATNTPNLNGQTLQLGQDAPVTNNSVLVMGEMRLEFLIVELSDNAPSLATQLMEMRERLEGHARNLTLWREHVTEDDVSQKVNNTLGFLRDELAPYITDVALLMKGKSGWSPMDTIHNLPPQWSETLLNDVWETSSRLYYGQHIGHPNFSQEMLYSRGLYIRVMSESSTTKRAVVFLQMSIRENPASVRFDRAVVDAIIRSLEALLKPLGAHLINPPHPKKQEVLLISVDYQTESPKRSVMELRNLLKEQKVIFPPEIYGANAWRHPDTLHHMKPEHQSKPVLFLDGDPLNAEVMGFLTRLYWSGKRFLIVQEHPSQPLPPASAHLLNDAPVFSLRNDKGRIIEHFQREPTLVLSRDREPKSPLRQTRLLFVGVQTVGTKNIDYATERKNIKKIVEDAVNKGWSDFTIEEVLEAEHSERDMFQRILVKQPHIIHVVSHGTPNGKLVLGREKRIEIAINTFLNRLKTLSFPPFVFLNVCRSAEGAKAGSTFPISGAIFVNGDVETGHAEEFAQYFYQKLLMGSSVQEAFEAAQTVSEAGNKYEIYENPSLIPLRSLYFTYSLSS